MMFREMHYEGSLWPQVIAAIAVSLGSLSIGFSSGYTSPALVTMLNSTKITVTDEEGSWVGGLLPLAALLGAIVGGPLVDYLGRKTTIIGTAAPFFIGWLFIAVAKTVNLVLLGRTICGLCVGIDSLAIPVYIGEVLHPKVRGALGLFPTAIGNIGILICYSAGMFLNWSQLAHLGAALTVPFLVLMLIIPETPKWYVLHKREEDARKAMQWLRGKNANIDTEVADMALRDDISSKSASVKDVFLGKYRKSILITIGLMAFQQLSGVSAVIFYTVQIFKMSGSSIDENLSTIIVGIVNFCSTFVAAIVIDHAGRKILLYVSAITMSLTIIVLGVFFYIRDAHKLNVDHLGWLPLSMVTLYLIGFSMGFGPVPWLMMGEILPAKIRGPAASICTAFNWLCTFVVTKTFHNILHVIGPYGAFWMFGVICFIGLFFVIVWVPETKGKSLEQIENQLTGLKEFVRRISAH